MQNCKLLFEHNEASEAKGKKIRKKLKFNKPEMRYYYDIKAKIFTGDQIYEILNVINYIRKVFKGNVPITFNLGITEFSDKLVYVVLESIYYYLIKELRHDVNIIFEAKHTIWSEGIKYSPLVKLSSWQNYIKYYESDLSMNHFRRLVPNRENRQDEYLSILMQDIFCFLKNNGVNEDVCEQLAEAITELAGNAGEHGCSECLVDIDITEDYVKDNDESDYYGMNAVILNYSPTLFFEPLKDKLASTEVEFTERYEYVKKAKSYHEQNFDEAYNENDFYTVSSFQHKISGNIRKNSTGGTGLTHLLHSLEENSDTYYCYILSGNRVVFFEKDCLLYDEKQLVGFNHSKNYLSDIPDRRLLNTIRTFLPGVAYNLNYAIKKEW